MRIDVEVPGPATAEELRAAFGRVAAEFGMEFELWDARVGKVGKDGGAVLADGICAREGPLWDDDNPRKASAWQGPIGKVLGTGLPVIESGKPGLAAGYGAMVALPVYQGADLAHIVAWYV